MEDVYQVRPYSRVIRHSSRLKKERNCPACKRNCCLMESNPMRSDRVGVFPSDIEELARCIVNGPLLFGKERASVVAGQLMFRVTPTASKKSRLFRLIAGALANGMHRHRIARPQRENRCDTRPPTIRPFSCADGPPPPY